MPRLARGGDEHRRIRVGKVIDPAITAAMDVEIGVVAAAKGPPAHQRVVAPRSRLPDVHEIPHERHPPQHRMIMGRLMGIAPAPAFDFRPVFL